MTLFRKETEMKFPGRFSFQLLALLTLAATPVFAIGPVDVEIGGFAWQNDLELRDGTGVLVKESGDAAAFMAGAWIKRFGVRVSHYESDTDNIGDVKYDQAELLFKVAQFGENDYVAVGAGAQRLSLDFGDAEDDTTGVRVLVEGRVGIVGMLYGYAYLSVSPDLGDLENLGLRDVEGRERELGVGIHPFPFLWVRGGYREVSFDLKDAVGEPEIESSGFVLGAVISF
jgi:hypothetical protein